MMDSIYPGLVMTSGDHEGQILYPGLVMTSGDHEGQIFISWFSDDKR